MEQYLSHSPEETIAIGEAIGKSLKKGSILCFFGELAAGKTTLIKGIARGVNGFSEEEVTSPTFVYLNIYEGTPPVYHFDLYRLKDEKEFLAMGFDEYLFSDGVSCIEWSERIAPLLSEEQVHLELSHVGENQRLITVKR